MLRPKLGVLELRWLIRRLLARKLRKLIVENATLRKFMFQSPKFTHCCSCYILGRRLQGVDSPINRRSGVCC